MKYFLIAISLIPLAYSADIAHCVSKASQVGAAGEALGECQDVVRPQCFPKNSLKRKNPESSAQTLMIGKSDDEVAMRLIFAEYLASKCLETGKRDGIIEGITHAIQNRVNSGGYGSGTKGVVFKKYQFRSSFGSCNSSEKEFLLCPTNHPQFERIWPRVMEIYHEVKSGRRAAPHRRAEFYYFPKHYDNDGGSCGKYAGKAVYDGWVKKLKLTKVPFNLSGLTESNECFHLWRSR